MEILAVLVAITTWKEHLRGKYFWIRVDNEAVATILYTGDSTLQEVLRTILMIAAKYEFMIEAKHIKGIDNRIPDWLSRWKEPEARKKFREYAKEKSLQRIEIDNSIIFNHNNW